jgi:hypothetical protein
MAKSNGKTNGHGLRRGFIGYASYMFIGKDPGIDANRTFVKEEFGSLKRTALKEVELRGGPKAVTLAAWFFGETKQPRNSGLEACARACGYHRPWQRMSAAEHAKILKPVPRRPQVVGKKK